MCAQGQSPPGVVRPSTAVLLPLVTAGTPQPLYNSQAPHSLHLACPVAPTLCQADLRPCHQRPHPPSSHCPLDFRVPPPGSGLGSPLPEPWFPQLQNGAFPVHVSQGLTGIPRTHLGTQDYCPLVLCCFQKPGGKRYPQPSVRDRLVLV